MENNTKFYLIILGVLVIGVFAFFSFQNSNLVDSEELLTAEMSLEEGLDKEEIEKETEMDSFIQCLVDKGMIVYASRTCPACTSFSQIFGGYDKVENLFIMCDEERERCMEEIVTGYVPEIQLNGEVYQGQRSLEGLAEATSCDL